MKSARTASSPRRHRTGIGIAALGAAAVVMSLAHGPSGSEQSRPLVAHAATIPARTADTLQRTWIEMRNVDLRVAEDAAVGIRVLRGEVIPTGSNQSAFLDSTGSFTIRITSGTVAIKSADLGVILN